MKIYIAGPLTTNPDETFHRDSDIFDKNVRFATAIALKLIKMGHTPYIPHRHIGGLEGDLTYDVIMNIHATFIKHWADALFFIGPSRGSNIELREAEKKGIPVFTSMEQVPKET